MTKCKVEPLTAFFTLESHPSCEGTIQFPLVTFVTYTILNVNYGKFKHQQGSESSR